MDKVDSKIRVHMIKNPQSHSISVRTFFLTDCTQRWTSTLFSDRNVYHHNWIREPCVSFLFISNIFQRLESIALMGYDLFGFSLCLFSIYFLIFFLLPILQNCFNVLHQLMCEAFIIFQTPTTHSTKAPV